MLKFLGQCMPCLESESDESESLADQEREKKKRSHHLARQYVTEAITRLDAIIEYKNVLQKQPGITVEIFHKDDGHKTEEIEAGAALKRGLETILLNKELNVMNLSHSINDTISRVQSAHPEGFKKHGGLEVLKKFRPASKLQEFCDDLIKNAASVSLHSASSYSYNV